ncbi:LacI family DNA-binding transcriptional regulator [Gryllotalpicola ginsengisoli]|uniref:LacI family DNA-binding transcriptional regulator n=1 Tax=Gryllotalpicola ginsengisoli TaxID=444608 RepID=UPI0003B3528A|nr:LacI family DNA-binding transcriptional regulator [Gryllotalpicola ginsengisoli]
MPPAEEQMQPGRAGASIRDVARIAGVSHMTVSRVLNQHPNVSPATRERVEAAISRLNFRPSRTARALAHGSSRVIGVLEASGGRLYGPASTIAAIEDAARSQGYSVMIAVGDGGREDAVAAVEHLLDQGAVGIIVVGPGARAGEVMTDAAPGVPFVAMHAARGAESVSADQAAGGRSAARHLLDLGHTAIAHLAGPSGWLEAEARAQGFAAELARAGLEPVRVEAGDWTPDSGYAAGKRMLAGGGFTAVFCANDQMALGLLHAAREAGIAVPEELSVVGFDDVPEAVHYAPALTTLRQDFPDLGRRAIATLLARLGVAAQPGPAPAPQLIVRASTRGIR